MELQKLREQAAADFRARGYPGTKEEQWRFTDVSRLAEAFADPAGAVRDAETWEPSNAGYICLGGPCLVFDNGRFSPKKSRLDGLPPGVRIGSVQTAADARIGSLAHTQSAFVSANTAHFNEGAVIEIADGAVLEEPIHLIYLADTAGAAFHLRNVIACGEKARVAVVEEYIGGPASADGSAYWTNAVTEVFVDEDGAVDHFKIQREQPSAFHFQTIEAELGRRARFSSHAITLGGALGRNDIRGRLAGEGGEAVCNGLYLLRERQHFDTHMFMDHAVPGCVSHELYKGILDEKAHAVFCGRIRVAQDAQQTDAVQSNGNLLLSRDARVNTLPQLEIYADDVKCTHGATVGQLDAAALYYLQTRGIDPRQGRALLTFAFANEVLDQVGSAPVKQHVERLVHGWLEEVDR